MTWSTPTDEYNLYQNAAVLIESSPVSHSRSLLTFKTIQHTIRLDDHRAGRQGTCSSIRLQRSVHVRLQSTSSPQSFYDKSVGHTVSNILVVGRIYEWTLWKLICCLFKLNSTCLVDPKSSLKLSSNIDCKSPLHSFSIKVNSLTFSLKKSELSIKKNVSEFNFCGHQKGK